MYLPMHFTESPGKNSKADCKEVLKDDLEKFKQV